VHSSSVQRAGELTPLERTRVPGERRCSSLPSDGQKEGCVHQSIQRLPDLELADARVADQSIDVAVSVDDRKQRLLLGGKRVPVHHQARTVETEHDIEARDLLLDERPLVDPPRALQQERLRIDGDALGAIFRLHAGLEVEGAARPREQRVDGVLRVERPVHDRGVADAPAVEVDRAEAVVERESEASRLLSHREQLEDVGEARLLEATLDGH
jgi:hypothetical protein